jgi:two-component system response regulator TctD
MSSADAFRARWILVADGDKPAADGLAGVLLRARFRAYPVANGLEALRLAQRYHLGLAIVDVGLLDMTGYDLVRRLRSVAPTLPVVMTAGDYGPTAEVEARQLGIVQYLHKPLDLERLDKVVSRLLGGEGELVPNMPARYSARWRA